MSNKTEKFTEQDAAAIRSITDVHLQAVREHDPEAFLATCTDDIVFLPPDHAAVEGRRACRDYLEGFPTPSTFAAKFDDIEGGNDLAFSRGRATAEFDDGTTTFRWLAIFRKQPDGSWKMVRDIWNTD
ncbi:MAG TPA: nuclear transport factor 2 family protein [Rhodothermales bacterium]|nr:nuclear transport factor 2 family protein [Rhodothermales bacterium]